MNKMFSQPGGSVAKQVNKQAIARIFGLRNSQIGYISTDVSIDSYDILFEKESQTCWYRGIASGTPVTWDVAENLSITTDAGIFVLEQANILKELASENGSTKIGKCNSVVNLRKIEPKTNGDSILLRYVSPELGEGSGGEFVYDANDTTSADNGYTIIVTASGKRWKRPEAYIDMAWYGAMPGSDVANAWDAAVGYVDSFVRANGFDSRPTIYIKAGTYPTSRTLDIPSYVSVVAIGNVVLNGSALPADSYTVRIINKVTGVNTVKHSGWNLGGIGGNLKILGATKAGSVHGLFVGNTSAMSDCRNVSLYAVSIDGVYNGLTFGNVNTYLFNATKCHIEGCQRGVYAPSTTSINSGERMVFRDCVIAGADINQVEIHTPAFDITWDNTSFDFSYGHVIYAGPTWGYSKLAVINSHMEAYDGAILKAEAYSGTAGQANRYFYCNDLVVLPRTRQNIAGTNSPSKVSIDAPNTIVSAFGLDFRHEHVPYTKDIFMAVNTQSFTYSGYTKDPFFHVPAPQSIMNRGWDISEEVVGTVVNTSATLDALTNFTCTARNAMSVSVVSGASGPELAYTGASGGYLTLTPKNRIPVTPNSEVLLTASVSAKSSTGIMNVALGVNWYDASGNLISSATIQTQNMRLVFDNTTLPNYAEGNDRDIAVSPRRFRAPAGAFSCSPTWQLSAHIGVVNVTRLVCAQL